MVDICNPVKFDAWKRKRYKKNKSYTSDRKDAVLQSYVVMLFIAIFVPEEYLSAQQKLPTKLGTDPLLVVFKIILFTWSDYMAEKISLFSIFLQSRWFSYFVNESMYVAKSPGMLLSIWYFLRYFCKISICLVNLMSHRTASLGIVTVVSPLCLHKFFLSW